MKKCLNIIPIMKQKLLLSMLVRDPIQKMILALACVIFSVGYTKNIQHFIG
ncbi:hypothetical protein Trebr_2457 [Treponema brennaborense DSM 12168]|uniref:Uncharacterized protein n=1 Tax=Treponema brennaborense (strain DSM 12168 / CIP 105900 / DD5/3) TaxID=906968 RepID=F4LMX3_TREBD|nr:hypothetical protein Trebr_2457 [Treponema brennaborense DSM 12168]